MPPQDSISSITHGAPAQGAPLTLGKFKASKMIVMQSWALLKKDKEIMWFPVLSGLTSIIALVLFGIAIFFITLGGQFANIDHFGTGDIGPLSYVVLFVYYIVMYFVTNFFMAGIYVIAHGRFNGKDLTFRDGTNGALENIGKIFWWSCISATVGIVLRIIADRSKLIGKIVVALFGAAWAILTYFSLPSLVIGKMSVKDSFKQSASIIRKTWGETIIIDFGAGLFFLSLILAGFAVTICVWIFIPSLVAIIGIGTLFVVYMFFIVILSSSLGAIFKLALYEYAVSGRVPDGFSPELIQNAVRQR